MSSVFELMTELEIRGVVLTVWGDRIRVDAPAATVTPQLRAAIAEHKADLLALLQPPATPLPSPFRIVDGPMDFGDVCAGWTPHCWATELRRKADRCDAYRPDIAKWYRDWAADIETRLQEGRP